MKHKFLLNHRLIFHSLGALLLLEGIAMIPPAILSVASKESCAVYWLSSVFGTFLLAILGYFGFKKEHGEWGKRESYLVVASVWVLFSLISSVPMILSGATENFTDAFFESMSGFSTTGASVIANIDELPRSVLLWRAIMQWLGGMGIIVLSLSFGFGGMQLYIAEVSGPTKEKMSPRVMQTAQTLWSYYSALTIIAISLLGIAGMDFFDALCNGLCTVSTGGFCTKAASIGFWGESPMIQYVMIFFMTFCSINFTISYFAFNGHLKKAFCDEECRYFVIVFLVVLTITFILNNTNMPQWDTEQNIRHSAFMVASAISGSGFGIDNVMTWAPSFWVLYFFVMVLGGCSGSATGGMKTVRVSVLAKNSYEEFKRMLHPNAIVPIKFNGQALSHDMVNNVLAFVTLYIFIGIFAVFLFQFTGLKFGDSVGVTISGLCNTGLGFGTLSSGNFYILPDTAKWIYCSLMLIGRLEIFTVLALFMPSFWRR